MLTSCTQQEVMLSAEEESRQDSAALHVAVMPIWSCLPVFYAERTGLMDSAGVDLRLHRFHAQMDIDTAMIRKHAHIGISDIIRAIRINSSPTQVTVFMGTEEPLTLIATKGKRVRSLNQMKEKMIAISRHSMTDYWCDQMLKTTNLTDEQVYRVQINDIKLRADMLRTGLLEGAFVTEPYASWIMKEGHKRLFRTKQEGAMLSSWIVLDSITNDSTRCTQIERFVQAYRIAIRQMNEAPDRNIIRDILEQEYLIPQEAIDSLRLPTLTAPFVPRKQDAETAAEWLRERGKLPPKYNPEHLFNTKLTPSK